MKARLTLLLVWLTCLMLSSSPAIAADEIHPEAVKHFNAGVAYVDDPTGSKWEEALKEFRAAYAIHPTWKFANNIGLSALNLERDGEAIAAYEEYLKGGGEKSFGPKQRKQMEKDIAMLSASLVRVTLTVEPADAILIDERKNSKGGLVVNQYPIQGGKASLGVHPGLHKVTVQASGYVTAEWSFNAEPASTHQHDFKLEAEKKPESAPAPVAVAPENPAKSTLEPPKPVQRKTPASVYVGLAATGVFAAAGTITGVLALKKDKDYDAAIAAHSADADSIKKSGQTYALLADIGVGAAVLSAGVTAYLYITAPKVAPEKPRSASIHLSPTVSPSAAGLAVSGKF